MPYRPYLINFGVQGGRCDRVDPEMLGKLSGKAYKVIGQLKVLASSGGFSDFGQFLPEAKPTGLVAVLSGERGMFYLTKSLGDVLSNDEFGGCFI